jgi:hypothetical protein
MKSATPGKNTSAAEVVSHSAQGFSLRLGEERLFLRFSDFPWFRKATRAQIAEVQWPSPDHLYWPALDVDLAVDSIRRPHDFPLVAKATD